MITLLALSLLCIVGVVLLTVVLLLVGIPLAILMGLLPWFLNLAAVVLLIKGLLDRPFCWENLYPAAGVLLLSALIRWIF